MPSKTILIDGKQTLSKQLRALAPYGQLFAACDVLLVTPAGTGIPPSTYVSAKEKVKVFSGLGFRVRSVMANQLAPQHWSGTRKLFYIAQNPICIEGLPADLLQRGVNLDAVSPFPEYIGSSAVVEAVMRCVDGCSLPLHPCVVVGARGRVGSRVALLLRNRGIAVHGLDVGDDLAAGLANAAVVITATGAPWLIHASMLGPSCRLVLDVGYHYNENTGEARGDVSPDCYSLPAAISPVPGGIGPLQVLTLVERAAARVQGLQYVPWTVRLEA